MKIAQQKIKSNLKDKIKVNHINSKIKMYAGELYNNYKNIINNINLNEEYKIYLNQAKNNK